MLRTYIDGNSVGYAAASRKGKKLVAGSQETTAVFGSINTIRRILEGSISRPVVLWDGRSWRYERFPDYKGNRTATAEQVSERERYKSQKKHLARALHYLGLPQIIAGNMEADDLAAIMTQRAIAKGDQVNLITGDKDWIQLVETGVIWTDHKIDRKCTTANFHEMTGFRTQRAFIHGKGLQGDAGDNVKPNTGIGEAGAVELLSVFADVHEFQQCSQEDAVARWTAAGLSLPKVKKNAPQVLPAKYQKLRDDYEIISRFEFALELMDLSHPTIPTPVNLRATRGAVDKPAFEALCAELAFSSILRNVDAFLKPFIQAQEDQ